MTEKIMESQETNLRLTFCLIAIFFLTINVSLRLSSFYIEISALVSDLS